MNNEPNESFIVCKLSISTGERSEPRKNTQARSEAFPLSSLSRFRLRARSLELWRYPINMCIKLYLKKSFEVLFFVIVVVVVSLFSFLPFFFF